MTARRAPADRRCRSRTPGQHKPNTRARNTAASFTPHESRRHPHRSSSLGPALHGGLLIPGLPDDDRTSHDLRPHQAAEQVEACDLLAGKPRPVIAVALFAPEDLPAELAILARILLAHKAPGVVGLGPHRD